MADLDTVKIVLRSLLISTQRCMTVHDLQNDYRAAEFHECPYTAFGYKSFLAFLQSIPDTVTVYSSGEVKAVPTKETAHIQQLVALQKNNSKKKRRPTNKYYGSSYGGGSRTYGSGGGFYAPSRSTGGSGGGYRSYGVSSGSYRGGSRSYGSSSGSYGGSSRTYGTSSGSYGSGTKSYGASSGSFEGGSKSDGKSSENYGNSTHRSHSSERVPSPSQSRYREDPYPSYSIEEHFERVKEVKEKARLEQLRSSSYSVPTVKAPTAPADHHPPPSYTIEDHFANVRKIKEEARQRELSSVEASPPQHPADDTNHSRMLPGGKESTEDSDDSFYERFHDSDGDYPVQVKSEISNPTGSLDDLSALENSSSTKVNDTMKNNLRNLIKSYPSGLWACVLPEKYEEKFGVRLNWNELGFDSIIQMAHELPDIFNFARVKSGDWMLYDVSSDVSVNECDNNKPVIDLPPSVKRKIFDIVERYTSGIRGEQLAQLYEEYYGKSLISEAAGYSSLEDLFSSLHNTVIRVRNIRKECYVYPGEKPKEQLIPAFKVDVDDKRLMGLFPEEVMGPGESFASPQLPSNLEPGEYIELRVAEIYTPLKFWIMLRKDNHALNKLMDELQDFYLDHGAKYVMPDCTVVEGQCCVAIYDSEWHRSVIKSVGETIEVLYVDYGTVSKCPRNNIRFIHKDFNVLPAQAIRASLCGIQPPNGRQRFTREASYAFLKQVAEKELIGLVQKADLEEPFLELFLIDTTGETDVHVNDMLVSEGHASFKDDLLGGTEELIKEINEELEENSPPKEIREDSKEENSHEKCQGTAENAVSLSTNCPTSSAPYSHSNSVPSATSPASTNLHQTQGAPVSHMPPPGFGVPSSETATMGVSASASYPSMINPLNPLMNPAFAAYSGTGMPQASTAFLLQQQWQQQQQAIAFAYYQNLYQQSAALLSAQARATAAAAATTWPSATSSYQQQSSYRPTSNTQHVSSEMSSSGRDCEISRGKSSSGAWNRESPSSSSSEDYDSRNRVVSRRKKGVHSTPNSSKLQQKFPLYDSDNSEESFITSSSSSHQNVAPDIVQSVGNLNLSHSSSSIVTNFWKIVEIDGRTLHLFNIDQKAFISTGELARKFTQFSTCHTLVTVLKNMSINPPYFKIPRHERLHLFSALDGYDGDIKCFDLSRNKNGSVIGTFHLTPLINVPSMIIPIGLEQSVVKEFQHLRDSFNPNDKYWTDVE